MTTIIKAEGVEVHYKTEAREVITEVRNEERVIWSRDNSVQRNKIGADSKQALINAIENKDGDTFRRHIYEILTGETVEETKKK